MEYVQYAAIIVYIPAEQPPALSLHSVNSAEAFTGTTIRITTRHWKYGPRKMENITMYVSMAAVPTWRKQTALAEQLPAQLLQSVRSAGSHMVKKI